MKSAYAYWIQTLWVMGKVLHIQQSAVKWAWLYYIHYLDDQVKLFFWLLHPLVIGMFIRMQAQMDEAKI